MTYKEYLKAIQKGQRDYIRAEQSRMKKAWRLWDRYQHAMKSQLNLHPLSPEEMRARNTQLLVMATRIDETHGDTPANRSLFEMIRAVGTD